MEAETEDDQAHIMEEVLLNCSSFVNLKILEKLNTSTLTANSLYSEVPLWTRVHRRLLQCTFQTNS